MAHERHTLGWAPLPDAALDDIEDEDEEEDEEDEDFDEDDPDLDPEALKRGPSAPALQPCPG